MLSRYNVFTVFELNILYCEHPHGRIEYIIFSVRYLIQLRALAPGQLMRPVWSMKSCENTEARNLGNLVV